MRKILSVLISIVFLFSLTLTCFLTEAFAIIPGEDSVSGEEKVYYSASLEQETVDALTDAGDEAYNVAAEDYRELFAKSLTVDGFYTDAYASELAARFEQNPNEFIFYLAYEDANVIDTVSYLLVCEQLVCCLDEFQSIITNLQEAEQNSLQTTVVLNTIQTYIELFTEDLETPIERQPVPSPDAFHTEVIRGFIDTWIALGMQNAENVFDTLADAYIKDPALFASIIADLDTETVDGLALGIANNLCRFEKPVYVEDAYDVEMLDAPSGLLAAKILENIEKNIAGEKVVINDDIFASETEISPLVTYYSPMPTAVSSEYSGVFRVGETVVLSVEIVEAVNRSQVRQYTITIYTYRNGQEVNLCTPQTVTMSPGAISINVDFQIELSAAEELETYVQISAPATGIVLIDDPMVATYEVTGQWHITVELTENRSQIGTITLYNASGAEVSHSICLGKSAKNLPMNQTNGHTPIGIYSGSLGNHNASDIVYGPYKVVKMQGISGYVYEECSHRYGLWIHGGREGYNNNTNDPSYPLYHTYGCVRVTNAYQLQLQNEILGLIDNYHDEVGMITITQDGQITLEE